MKDISIICGNGGLQGAFIAGVLSRMIDEFPDHFDRIHSIYACSASVGNLCYYLSHGYQHRGRDIWTKQIPNSDFMRYKGLGSFFSSYPIYDVDHLVDDIFIKNNPICERTIFNHHIKAFIPVYNVITDRVEYFTNDRTLSAASPLFKDITQYSIYEVIRAAVAIPIMYDKPVAIKESLYCDAGIVEPFCTEIPGADSNRHIIIIAAERFKFRAKLALWIAGFSWLLFSLLGWKARLPSRAYWRILKKPSQMKRLYRRAKAKRDTLIISPQTSLRSTLDASPGSMSYNFNLGEEYVKTNRDRIGAFLYPEVPRQTL